MNAYNYTIRANSRRKTYTIRVYHKGKFFAKYRSLPMGSEFLEVDYWTQDDIRHFLSHSDAYYKVQ